ncbi:unnamed protein product [Acanthoscelides obtectus]|uniref:Thymidylate kinase-like domain-containing protein n=2 Tax=Acanthoscelides obtectus TaxID=200917 RepID=A0A9P0LS41_ACAOB|nr:unnamed protein product [Acanthoscelides obtectus]CAK1678123.1 UMP-CMP kinase 2, mitochondrial [Acanthoscelides obtectus]
MKFCFWVSHRQLIGLGTVATRHSEAYFSGVRKNCYFNYEETVKMGDQNRPLLYKNLKSILDVFDDPENKKVKGVSELMEIFLSTKLQHQDIADENKKHPLIVLEGLDGSGKTTVGKRFSKKINAQTWKTPPESIGHIRHLFDNHPVLRTAYYSLGNYIAAYEVQSLLKYSPVLMDRYWHSTAAYAIAQYVQDHPEYPMPAEGDPIYKWPEDLFKPDIVIFLNVSEEVRKQRQSRRTNITVQEDMLNSDLKFRQNVIQAFRNMYNPGVHFINADLDFEPKFRLIEAATKDLLKL